MTSPPATIASITYLPPRHPEARVAGLSLPELADIYGRPQHAPCYGITVGNVPIGDDAFTAAIVPYYVLTT
eukprot:1255954-Prymnesium_polylepis.1